MDTEQRLSTEALAAQHKKSMDEARRLEPAVMVTERNWNAMLKMQHDLFQQQIQLDADLKTLLTRAEAQESLIKMQTSADEFARQAGSLNERYSSGCKALTESTKLALTEILNDTKKQLSNTVQETRKKIRTCAWISITALILCATLCALAVLWSRWRMMHQRTTERPRHRISTASAARSSGKRKPPSVTPRTITKIGI